MTVTRDVETRLAQGRPMVDDFEEYVRACQHLGYTHPDLTARAGQVHDWYATEDGLRLDLLSADADALAVTSRVSDSVVRRQSDLVATLTAAWSGHGSESALEFLTRNQRAATAVGAAVRDAAQTLNALRDELWNAVDAKVAATLATDVGARAEWLAAARTVTSDGGDRSTASELVDQRVKPFVHDVIATRWVGAMRSHGAAVEAAYRTALARLDAAGGTVFEVPGQLGLRYQGPASPTVARGQVEPGGTSVTTPRMPDQPVPASLGAVPASVGAPSAPWAGPQPTVPSAAESTAPQPLPTQGALPASGSPLGGDLGSLGSGPLGSGSPASGASGIGQQLADLIGGLLGGADAVDPDSLDSADADADADDDADADADDATDAAEDDATDEDDTGNDPEDDSGDDPDGEGDAVDATSNDETLQDPVPVPPDPATVDPAGAQPNPPPPIPAAPLPTFVPTPPDGAEESTPPAAEPTPCELAVDELPRVGE